MRPRFWHGRRVLVTGHTGFKGGWLSLWLANQRAHVSGFALDPPTMPSFHDVTRLAELVDSTIGDVRDADAVNAAVAASRPEIVFHLAAQPLVRASYEDPVFTYGTNVMGTVNLLEAIRRSATVRAVVVVSSDKCYDNPNTPVAHREQDPMGGADPYSSSKGCAELVTAAYRSSYFDAASGTGGVAIATARAGNVIGGGDWARDRLVPDCIRALGERRAVAIRNPAAVRPWQHVLEPIAGYLALGERLLEQGAVFAEAWNFGPSEADCRPVAWLVDTLARLSGGTDAVELDSGPHPKESVYLKLDSTKARTRLGWAPRWELETALAAALEWHEGHRAGRDMREVSLQQIGRYMRGGDAIPPIGDDDVGGARAVPTQPVN